MPNQISKHKKRTTIYVDRKLLERYQEISDQSLSSTVNTILALFLGGKDER